MERIREGDTTVLHPEVGRYMESFESGQYYPNRDLTFRFPDDWPQPDYSDYY